MHVGTLGEQPRTSAHDADIAALRARVLITRAVSRFGLDGTDAAMVELETARGLAHDYGLGLLLLQTHLQESAIRVAQDDWRGALAALTHLEGRLDELPAVERCSALLNRGLASVSLHDLDRGRADLEAALAIAVREGLTIQEYKARHNLGCVAWFAGDIPRALGLMAIAAAMPVQITRARGFVDQGRVLLDAGLLDEAEAVLGHALDAARRERHTLELGQVHLDLAQSALLRDDPAQARHHATLAKRAFRRVQAQTRADDVALFVAAIDVGRGLRLRQAAATALPHLTDAPTSSRERLAERITVDVSLARGDLARAVTGLRRLRTSPQASLSVRLHEWLLDARLAMVQRGPTAARRVLTAAAAELAHGQGTIHSLEVRAALAFHARRLRDLDVCWAAESGSAAELFDSVERWRAVSHRSPALLAPEDAQTRELLAELRQLRLDPTERRTDRVTALEARIGARVRTLSSAVTTTPPPPAVTAEEMIGALARREAVLVSFHVEAGLLVRIIATSDGFTSTTIGEVAAIREAAATAAADLDATAHTGAALRPMIERASAQSRAHLDALLLGDHVPPGSVVIVPTTALMAVTWRALPSLAGRPVVVAPSATQWCQELPRVESATVVALGGPDLPLAASEVAAVTAAWQQAAGASARRVERATTGDLRAALSSATVVHLAAHGEHVEQNPMFSAIRLHDGPLVAHDLPRPIQAQLVVLSACDVGRSRGRAGDEPLGLAAALLALGVHTVVASTNPVRDEVAADVMAGYHSRLSRGADAATALTEASHGIRGGEAFAVYGANWTAPH